MRCRGRIRSAGAVLAGWAIWAIGGVCLAAEPSTASDADPAPLPPIAATDETEARPTDCPHCPNSHRELDGCLVRAHQQISCLLGRWHEGRQKGRAAAAPPVEPPAPYHHSEFHPVPVRPPLAPAWMGQTDLEQIRAARAQWTQAPPARIPTQQIQISPPPMPDQTPRAMPSTKTREEVFAGSPLKGGENQVGERSWIFIAPELARRDPAPVIARRPDYAVPTTRR